jgi:hypothetical protein
MKEEEMIRVVESTMNVSLALKNINRIEGMSNLHPIWVHVDEKGKCFRYGLEGYKGIIIYRSLKNLYEYISFRPIDYNKVFVGFFEVGRIFHISNVRYMFLDQLNGTIILVIGK